MSPKYFQGRTITGPVEASPAQTFRDVVERFEVPAFLPLTRTAFFSLDKDNRDLAKRVPFFTAASFLQSPSKRDTPNATTCNLIFLDIDPEKQKVDGKWVETGRCPAGPFVRNPVSLYQALQGFNFVAHVTASSTPEKPRMRLVVEAQNIPLALYPSAVSSVGAMLGLECVTTESKVAVQPMFLPVMFKDSTADEHPLIAKFLEGRAFTVEDIGELSEVHHVNGANGKNGHAPPREASDALFFLRAPVHEVTMAVATAALEHVEPDCSYHEWLDVAQALRHQFSPHQAEEAYTLFDQWSQGGAKYKDARETRAKWDSIRQTPVGRMPITIRSLLRAAVSGGWDDGNIKESSYTAVAQWMEKATTITELLEKGVQKIVAALQLSNGQEAILIDQLRTIAKERFAARIPVLDIRADIKKLKAEMRAQSHSGEKTKDPVWAKNVVYISQAQDFYRHHTGEKYKADSFNAVYARNLLPTEDQLKDQGIPVNPATLSRPVVQPSDYALNHLQIPAVYDYAYDPSRPSEVWFVNRKRKYVNTYNPTYPELDQKNALKARKMVLNHLRHLITEEEYGRTLLDFMAYMVQFPGVKIRWAVLIQSAEGAGKTYFAKVMQAALGYEHVKILSDGAIKSGYNEWAFGHQLVAVEEIYVNGANRHAVMNAIKPLVTNDDISVDEKYRSNRQATNISNYMLFSNHHDALTITPNDRRYFVVKSSLQTKAQVVALGGKNYFTPLYDMVRDHPGAMRAFLMAWEISPEFDPNGHAPRTKYADEMVEDSASDLHAAVKRLLKEGDSPLVQWDITTSQALMTALTTALLLEGGIRHYSMQQLSAVLREEGFTQAGRHLFGDERHYVWARHGVCVLTAHEVALKRFKSGAKNMGMELL